MFGPPGAGSVIICTYADPSIIKENRRKTLIFTVLWLLCDFIKVWRSYQNVTDSQQCFINSCLHYRDLCCTLVRQQKRVLSWTWTCQELQEKKHGIPRNFVKLCDTEFREIPRNLGNFARNTEDTELKKPTGFRGKPTPNQPYQPFI